jgi:hypothetical protein
MFISSWVLWLAGYTVVSAIVLTPKLIEGSIDGFVDALTGKKNKPTLFDKEDIIFLICLPGAIAIFAVFLGAVGLSSIQQFIAESMSKKRKQSKS